MKNEGFFKYCPEDQQLVVGVAPQSIWKTFYSASIFITGGTGFVGCNILESLLFANCELKLNLSITVLSRDPDSFLRKYPHFSRHKNLTFWRGDVRNLSIYSGSFTHLIHAATDVVTPSESEGEVFDNIVQGMNQALDFALKCGVQRFLLTSSGAIYGDQPVEIDSLSETYLGSPSLDSPSSAYGLAKRYCEWKLNAYAIAGKIAHVGVARCFAFVGPYMALNAQFAIGNFIGNAIRNENIYVNGDGTPLRSYLYSVDLAIWLLGILAVGDGRAFNVGSDKAISILGLAELVSSTIGQDKKVLVAKDAVPGALCKRYIPNVDRAKLIGLNEYTNLVSAIIKTSCYAKKQLEWK